jgi:serine phosphatase RsbU (regulator of sigma subunit)
LCAPLKTEKRLLGLIFIVGTGPRRFTAGDLKLVHAIAMQTAPAIEISFLHQLELEKMRLERDLMTARRVQSGLLPQAMPVIHGWRIAALWQPARMVSGDLYEFLKFNDGKLGIAIADVTDKGVPAALIMANTRSVMRAVVSIMNRGRSVSPAKLLAEANRVLYEDIPLGMFVTCLLIVLDPVSGEITYANAGHNLPYLRTTNGVVQLHASGPALGLFPEANYEEHTARIEPGESLLMYSDGLPEAHNPDGFMFDYPRLQQLLAEQPDGRPLAGEALLQFLMDKLQEFTGPNWVQEDDVTLVAIERVARGI